VPLSKAEIAPLIPHSGAMCLLDEVLSWTENTIRASTSSHRDEHNPLRHRGRLPAVCGIEYAAQAMAIHGSLACMKTGTPRAGYLVSVREVVWGKQNLDDLESTLIIDAEQLMGDARGALYRFSLRHMDREVSSGSLMVVLNAEDFTR
jgi:predicted hotdog family 3-hydroxylacyl-ACP dehydratase